MRLHKNEQLYCEDQDKVHLSNQSITILTIHMIIVQYSIHFSGPLRNISNPCSAPLCATDGVSTYTTFNAFHALLLPSKILLNNVHLLHDKRAKNSFDQETKHRSVKPLRGGSKQLVTNDPSAPILF